MQKESAQQLEERLRRQVVEKTPRQSQQPMVITRMAQPEHGWPYDRPLDGTFMMREEHGQPFNRQQQPMVITRMAQPEHGRPYDRTPDNSFMMREEHGRPFNRRSDSIPAPYNSQSSFSAANELSQFYKSDLTK